MNAVSVTQKCFYKNTLKPVFGFNQPLMSSQGQEPKKEPKLVVNKVTHVLVLF